MQLPGVKTEAILEELLALQAEEPTHNLSQFRSLISAEQYQRLYQLTQQYLALGSTILDWGCGNGHFSYFLLRSHYKTHGYAFEDFYFRSVLEPLGYQFLQGNLAEAIALPYADQQFDGVLSVGVLEHVRETGGNELASLKEIFRLLKPGGYFICYHFPNQFSWIDAIAALIPHKHHHQYRYTQPQIQQLCQTAGFRVLECQRYGFLPRNFWGNLPASLRNLRSLAHLWNLSDTVLSYSLSLFCQNYWFVAQKPSDSK